MLLSIDRFSVFGGSHFFESCESFIGRFTVRQIEHPIKENEDVVPNILGLIKIISGTLKITKHVLLVTNDLKVFIYPDTK
jgi:hypothetical protein